MDLKIKTLKQKTSKSKGPKYRVVGGQKGGVLAIVAADKNPRMTCSEMLKPTPRGR
jgi:hypothetical protein